MRKEPFPYHHSQALTGHRKCGASCWYPFYSCHRHWRRWARTNTNPGFPWCSSNTHTSICRDFHLRGNREKWKFNRWSMRAAEIAERSSCTLRLSVVRLGNHLIEILFLSLNHTGVNLQLQSKFCYFIPALYTHGLKNGHQLRNSHKTNCSRRKRRDVKVRINVHKRGRSEAT